MKTTIVKLVSVVIAGAALAASAALPASAVIGGVDGSTERDPWMVFLADPHAFPDAPSHFGCGGALVTPTKVVTAAHCVDESVLGNLEVVGGRTDLRSDEGEVREVVSIYAHEKVPPPPPPPGSNPLAQPGGDVAVLSLDRPLPYRTLPLATPEEADVLYRAGAPARVLGWGISSEEQLELPPGRSATPILQQAQLPLVSVEDCEEAALHGSPHPIWFDSAHYVCGGYAQGGVASSGGDSGGPLVINGKLAGVTALAVARGDEPRLADVYTGYSRITAFYDEIVDHLAEPGR